MKCHLKKGSLFTHGRVPITYAFHWLICLSYHVCLSWASLACHTHTHTELNMMACPFQQIIFRQTRTTARLNQVAVQLGRLKTSEAACYILNTSCRNSHQCHWNACTRPRRSFHRSIPNLLGLQPAWRRANDGTYWRARKKKVQYEDEGNSVVKQGEGACLVPRHLFFIPRSICPNDSHSQHI